jgi:hypothetical protein
VKHLALGTAVLALLTSAALPDRASAQGDGTVRCSHCEYPCPLGYEGIWIVDDGLDILWPYPGCEYGSGPICNELIHCDAGNPPDDLDQIEDILAAVEHSGWNPALLIASGAKYELLPDRHAIRVNGCGDEMIALLPLERRSFAAFQAALTHQLHAATR